MKLNNIKSTLAKSRLTLATITGHFPFLASRQIYVPQLTLMSVTVVRLTL